MSFKTSQGERIPKSEIDHNIRVVKAALISDAVDEGKQYCWACGTTRERLSCSHIISVNNCQNDGRCEYAWRIDNLQLECLKCHAETETRKFAHHANARYKNKFIEEYNLSKTEVK